ncbi:MAG: hypothetical protein N3I35_02945 [Clostridia bacterium]|nr:hypothetical protein [Clostridia bacterium]
MKSKLTSFILVFILSMAVIFSSAGTAQVMAAETETTDTVLQSEDIQQASEPVIIQFPDGIPETFKHMDTQAFNDYIERLVMKNEAAIKAKVVGKYKDVKIKDFKIKGVSFDILTGNLDVKIWVKFEYKYWIITVKSEGKGILKCELRTNEDYSKIGIYCHKLDNFSMDKVPGTIARWIGGEINNKIGDRMVDNSPVLEKAFNNVCLTDFANKTLSSKLAADQFIGFEAKLPGGAAKVSFKDIEFNTFDIGTGKASISASMSAEAILDSGESIKMDNIASLNVDIDLYIDSKDDSLWVRISTITLTVNDLDETINAALNAEIKKELEKRNPCVQISFNF